MPESIFGLGQRRKLLQLLRVEMLPQNRSLTSRPATAGDPKNGAGQRTCIAVKISAFR